MTVLRKHIPFVLIAILILASVLRVYRLGDIPVGMSDDEIRASMTAFSVWQTGKDLYRPILFPFSFIIDSFTFSPVPVYLQAPFLGLFGLTPFAARLPFALGGIVAILLTYFVASLLTKSRLTAILAAFVLSVSVWHIQMSRMAYEGGIAFMLYVAGTFLFLQGLVARSVGLIIGAMGVFFLAFNSYNATKVIFLPVLMVLVIYGWRLLFQDKRKIAVIAMGVLLTFGVFVYFATTQQAGKHGSSPFIFSDFRSSSEAVELERRGSSAPQLLKVIYHNKATHIFRVVFDRYLFAFSPQYLLLTQEGSGIYSLWGRGNLYPFEGILLVLGFMRLFALRKKETLLMLGLLLVAPLPSGVGADPQTYLTRSSFMLPWLVIGIASGIEAVVCITNRRVLQIAIATIIACCYLYVIGGYLVQYYFEWPRYGAKYYSKGVMDLVVRLAKEKGLYRTITVGKTNGNAVLHYAFRNALSLDETKQILMAKKLRISNINFESDCIYKDADDPRVHMPPNSMHVVRASCHKQHIPDSTIESLDGIIEWKIYFSK